MTITASLTQSIDGYFASLDDDQVVPDLGPAFHNWGVRSLRAADRLLLGRRTYDLMASAWTDPRLVEQDPETAALMDALPKLVLTRKTIDEPWGQVTTAATLDAVRRATGLTTSYVLGSGSVVHQLLAAGALDELRIVVAPRVLGSGRSVFTGLDPLDLRLTEWGRLDGNIALTYRRGEAA